MKTTISIILAVIFPLLALTQEQNFQSMKLKTLDEKTVNLEEVCQEADLTILFFFNESCRNLTDQFDYLENLTEDYCDITLKIIAVYNASNGSYSHIKPLMSGYDISLETLIDVNGELQRAMGFPVNSTVIFTRYSEILSGQYSESVFYTPEQADIELSQFFCGDYHNSFHNQYLSHYLNAE